MPKYTREAEFSGRSAQELYDVVSRDIEEFLAKILVQDFKVDFQPDNRSVSFDSKMASATVYCEEGKVRLDGKLGLMAMPFKGKIDQAIDRWLQKKFSNMNADNG